MSKGALTLLDVRQAEELQLAQITGARHIPMNEIPLRFSDLDPQAGIALLCHHGSRSLQVARFLERNGFADVVNVAGGIDAWSELDPTIPRY